MPDHIIRTPEDKARLWRVVQGLSEDAPWRVSITRYRSRRSNDQNRRAFALYKAISDETGHTVDEVHAILKHKFGEPKTVKMCGVEVTEYTTRDRDVAWFANYLDQCEAWAATELGIALG
jgi:hypothetical protein